MKIEFTVNGHDISLSTHLSREIVTISELTIDGRHKDRTTEMQPKSKAIELRGDKDGAWMKAIKREIHKAYGDSFENSVVHASISGFGFLCKADTAVSKNISAYRKEDTKQVKINRVEEQAQKALIFLNSGLQHTISENIKAINAIKSIDGANEWVKTLLSNNRDMIDKMRANKKTVLTTLDITIKFVTTERDGIERVNLSKLLTIN
jgi:hypothetical protein